MKLISSRRAYEFRMDDLRLTILSLSAVQESVKTLFGFGGVEIGSPTPTFGPVQPTLPPGLVFHTGAWISPEKQLVPIRMMNFEPRRIVIDVAGPSWAIDPIYALLRANLQPLVAPDGSPAVGQPERIRDFSEISISFPLDPLDLLAPAAKEVFSRATLAGDDTPDAVVVPVITLQVQRAKDEFPGIALWGNTSLQLALRAGTQLAEHTYYSAAPLASDAHQAYLAALQEAMGVAELPTPALLDGNEKPAKSSGKRVRQRRSEDRAQR